MSPREVCAAVLARAERLNPALRAFPSLPQESAMELATAAEREWTRRRRRREAHDAPLLLGVPVSIEDTVDVAGAPTTMGSLAAVGQPAPKDELFVERLRAAGAVFIGKTNTPEFGIAAHTMNRLGDPCVNPWNTTRTAGGSSGGAAAACAVGLGPLHHGSDGVGSIRIPAAYCGVVGLKPTGRSVPRRRDIAVRGGRRARTHRRGRGPFRRRDVGQRQSRSRALPGGRRHVRPGIFHRGRRIAWPDAERAPVACRGRDADIDRVVRIMDGFFERHDALVLPTTATTAPRNLMRVPQGEGESVNPWILSTLHVSLVNLIQAPAAAIPVGFDREGLPTSVQIVCRPGDEVTLLRCAAVVEQALSRGTRPPMA